MESSCEYCRFNEATYREDVEGGNAFCSYVCQCMHRTVDAEDHLSHYMKAVSFDAVVTATKTRVRTEVFGPGSEMPVTIPAPMRKFMLAGTKYVGHLSLFEQYIIWRYTIGSASVNTYLIFGKVSNEANARYWCYLFFLYWSNTKNAAGNGRDSVTPRAFSEYQKYFNDPSLFKLLDPESEKTRQMTADIIRRYIKMLTRLIANAPAVKTGFHVYKVAAPYPGLPESPTDVPKTVTQKPFNSATINPHMNFAFFTREDATGNLFDLHIPAGVHVLYVPTDLHAYPFEKEIILPPECKFTVTGTYTGKLDVIKVDTVDLQQIQTPTASIIMGPVYEINQFRPCWKDKTSAESVCVSEKKDFTVYVTDYSVDK